MYNFVVTKIVNPIDDPNAVGELLRDKFFNQHSGLFGCYSTFQFRNDVSVMNNEVDKNADTTWKRACKFICGINIVMRYCSDGDYTLEFIFPDGSKLSNNDSKKDNKWKYIQ